MKPYCDVLKSYNQSCDSESIFSFKIDTSQISHWSSITFFRNFMIAILSAKREKEKLFERDKAKGLLLFRTFGHLLFCIYSPSFCGQIFGRATNLGAHRENLTRKKKFFSHTKNKMAQYKVCISQPSSS